MRRVLPFFLLPAALAFAAAGPAQADNQLRTCRTATSPTGARLTVAVQSGPSCATGLRTIRAYYRKAKAGKCVGNGCVTNIGRYRCFTNGAGPERSTGYSTICRLRSKPKARIVTLTN